MAERLQPWGCRKTIVCVDSYHNGVPKGRLYTPYKEIESFDSLTQFLIRMEAILDDLQAPQACTTTRRFIHREESLRNLSTRGHIRHGTAATFEIQVIFRQHTSWQGTVTWLNKKEEQPFRSVLELVLLMDSALRKEIGCDTA